VTGFVPRVYGDLQPVRAAELRRGDRVTFGDHTGIYRVRAVEYHPLPHSVTVRSWFRRARVVPADSWVWVKR